MDYFSIALGKRLKKLRKAKGMTQDKVAKKLGIQQTAVSHWEHGDFCPGAAYLVKLADCIGCSVDEILGRTRKV